VHIYIYNINYGVQVFLQSTEIQIIHDLFFALSFRLIVVSFRLIVVTSKQTNSRKSGYQQHIEGILFAGMCH